MTHEQAKAELQRGTPPELICATCPWDRLCIEPPTITEHEIQRQIDEAKAKDKAENPDGKGLPVGALLTVLTLGGRDKTGKLCPVFAARLRSHDGRRMADTIRDQMRGWDGSS